MFETTFKNLDDILRKDAGCASELDYIEQTSWILFLKWLDDFDQDKAKAAKLNNKIYKTIIDKKFQWSSWAAPKNKEGKLDHNLLLTGEPLKEFVDKELFTYFNYLEISTRSYVLFEVIIYFKKIGFNF